jgi:hypothetical protein
MRVPAGGSVNEVLTKTGSGDSAYDWQAAGAGSDTAAIHDNVASEISAITEKTTPASADLLIIEDSADSNNKKRVQVGNLPGGGAVDSVHGRTGAVVAVDGDYSQSLVTGLKTSDSPTFTGATVSGNTFNFGGAAAGNAMFKAVGDVIKARVGDDSADATITCLTLSSTGNISNGSGGCDIVGNITATGTIDGRDVAADGTKLDGIETAADVTDETNVVAALSGATLTSVTGASGDEILIQDSSDTDNLKTIPWSSVLTAADILWKPAFVIHMSDGLDTTAVSQALEIPSEISTINEIRIQARDADGALVSTTCTIDVRSKSWSSGAYTDASSGDNLSGTQPSLTAQTSDYKTSPALGSLTSGNMLQLAVSAITGTGTKTLAVQLICS